MEPNTGILRLTNVTLPIQAQVPVNLTDPLRIQTAPLGAGQLDNHHRHATLSKWAKGDQTFEIGAVSRGGTAYDPQIVTDLGRLIFQLSNKLSTGNTYDYQRLLANLAHELKVVAESASSWKGFLLPGQGATSKALIEQLFQLSITSNDRIFAKMLLEIGADPNQRLERCFSALDLAVRLRFKELIDLLLNSGAVCSQATLMYGCDSLMIMCFQRSLGVNTDVGRVLMDWIWTPSKVCDGYEVMTE